MNKGAVIYILRLFAERLIGAALFLLGAGSFDLRSGIFFSVYVAVALVSGIIIYRKKPETLKERGKVNTNSPKWDKILLLVFWLSAFFIVYFAAGKTVPPGKEIDFDFIAGMVIYLVSAVITVKAMLENTFLESTARLQPERNQTVIQTGPYSIVRHPTYSAVLLWCVAVRCIFPSAEVLILALAISAVISIRTELEDEMLKKGLPGYKEYSEKVKYRLIPFVW
ncbi:MAG: isoprenylcysteine carboxylmethyltransferase family protein [Oscillospiraceae bacterium]|nr:isoprenylcysteine carboxylmethyltransferase family protein [Oscillospiraceae bacterium]